jgi:hypothetical protein
LASVGQVGLSPDRTGIFETPSSRFLIEESAESISSVFDEQ